MRLRVKKRYKKNPLETLEYVNLKESDILSYFNEVIQLTNTSMTNVYVVRLNNSKEIFGKRLFSGQYVLKYAKSIYFFQNIKTMIELSRHRLIPKIFIINPKVIIMKYIKGVPLNKIINDLPKNDLKIIIANLEETLHKWHKLGFFHDDIGSNGNNVMVDINTFDTYLIDPLIGEYGIADIKTYTNKERIESTQNDITSLNYMKNKYLELEDYQYKKNPISKTLTIANQLKKLENTLVKVYEGNTTLPFIGYLKIFELSIPKIMKLNKDKLRYYILVDEKGSKLYTLKFYKIKFIKENNIFIKENDI